MNGGIMDLESLIAGVFVLGMAFGQAVSLFLDAYIERAARTPARKPVGSVVPADRR